MWFRGSSARRTRELVGDLVEHCERLKRRVDALELDYEALYDKVRSALQRISKRAEVVEKAHAEAPDLQDSGAAMPSAAPDGGGLLTARQKQIQQQVLRRRMGGSFDPGASKQ
jgi:hypothetical protein